MTQAQADKLYERLAKFGIENGFRVRLSYPFGTRNTKYNFEIITPGDMKRLSDEDLLYRVIYDFVVQEKIDMSNFCIVARFEKDSDQGKGLSNFS